MTFYIGCLLARAVILAVIWSRRILVLRSAVVRDILNLASFRTF